MAKSGRLLKKFLKHHLAVSSKSHVFPQKIETFSKNAFTINNGYPMEEEG